VCSFAELCLLPDGAELLSFSANSDDPSALYSAKRQDHPTVIIFLFILTILLHFPVLNKWITLNRDSNL
jgi:hypothetical protein